LLRVSLSRHLPCLPEISANKYAINIRFVDANYAAKSTVYEYDVPFELTFCSLSQ
jgi:cell division protein ZapD